MLAEACLMNIGVLTFTGDTDLVNDFRRLGSRGEEDEIDTASVVR
jgi:hypothetical protein